MEIKEKYKNLLNKILNNSNLDGNDYLEFKVFLNKFSQLNIEEKQIYLAAFTAIDGEDLTKEKLLDSINYYISILDKEKSNIINNIDSEVDVFKNKVENQIKILEKNKKDIDAQIEQFLRTSKTFEKQIKEQKEVLDNINHKSENEKNSFNETFQEIYDKIIYDKENIKNYL